MVTSPGRWVQFVIAIVTAGLEVIFAGTLLRVFITGVWCRDEAATAVCVAQQHHSVANWLVPYGVSLLTAIVVLLVISPKSSIIGQLRDKLSWRQRAAIVIGLPLAISYPVAYALATALTDIRFPNPHWEMSRDWQSWEMWLGFLSIYAFFGTVLYVAALGIFGKLAHWIRQGDEPFEAAESEPATSASAQAD